MLAKSIDHKCSVIDRTILEICRSNENIPERVLSEFALCLNQLGINLLELNRKAFLINWNLSFEFVLFRLGNSSDITFSLEHGIKHCVVNIENKYLLNEAQKLYAKGISVMAEIYADNIKEAREGVNSLEGMGFSGIDAIRFTGVSEMEEKEWKNIIARLHKNALKVDICPHDVFSTGTAAAFDSMDSGADSITASFDGYGRTASYAPIEEVMISMFVLKDYVNRFNLSGLPKCADLFCELTGNKIANNKPVTGSDIFAVESGIHTHGIDKCSITYEPYAPELVGQNRSVMIGKHSGRKSIERKLIQMHIDSERYDLTALLKAVREESIRRRRALNDRELQNLLNREDLICR